MLGFCDFVGPHKPIILDFEYKKLIKYVNKSSQTILKHISFVNPNCVFWGMLDPARSTHFGNLKLLKM